MEKTTMTDINRIADQALEVVTGGTTRFVDTGDDRNAAIRIAPGTGKEQIASLKNGTKVNTTGRFRIADGRNWAEINYPVKGWVKASIIGYER